MKKQILLSGMLAAILTTTRPALAQEDANRNAYFGELHIHSSYSCDAYVFGTKRLGPKDAIDLGSPEGLEYYDQAPFKCNGKIDGARVEYFGSPAQLQKEKLQTDGPISAAD